MPINMAAQTLTPHDIPSARRQRLYQDYFGFVSVQWEEVMMCQLKVHIFSASICRCVDVLYIRAD